MKLSECRMLFLGRYPLKTCPKSMELLNCPESSCSGPRPSLSVLIPPSWEYIESFGNGNSAAKRSPKKDG